MRAEIYRQLKGLGFKEKEAQAMSGEFARVLKSLGVASLKAIREIVKSLAVSLLHSWVLALLV